MDSGSIFMIVGFVICLIIASVIVNFLQNLFMKIIGADAMFFSAKVKIIIIIVVAAGIFGPIAKMFGIEI